LQACSAEEPSHCHDGRPHLVGDPRGSIPRNSSWSFFYLPLIIGLIIGSAAAAATDQWWWATVGAVLGAAVGEAVRRYRIGRSTGR
jgi:hypothetical protein